MKCTTGPVLAVVLGLSGPLAAGQELPARQILDKVDDLYRGQSSQGEMTMKVVAEHWTRAMKLRFQTKGKEKSLMRILAPRKEKGMATLKSGNNIWNYLPKVKRVIKLPSSMMGGSWMGSHFTNDDLVKESRMAEDFDFEISKRYEKDGKDLIEITCIPKPDAAVVWGKVEVTVRKSDHQPVQLLYYDEDMKLARSMRFSDLKKMGDRIVPMVMRVEPTDKPKEYTEVRYTKVQFDVQLDDKIFSIRNLQK